MYLAFVMSAPMMLTAVQVEEKPKEILQCVGFNKEANGTIGRLISIHDNYAFVDGVKYYFKSNDTYYWLRQEPTLKVPKENIHTYTEINRITGSYVTLDDAANIVEWSRPEDAGCKEVHRVI
jgi:hypothetical protein